MVKIGDKVKMTCERTRYTIQGFDDRFIIMSKPHFDTYMYTIVDRERKIRGPINMVLGPPCDVNNPEGAKECLEFMRTETGGWNTWGVSGRNNLPLTEDECFQMGIEYEQ